MLPVSGFVWVLNRISGVGGREGGLEVERWGGIGGGGGGGGGEKKEGETEVE